MATSLILAALATTALGGCALVDRRASAREARFAEDFPPVGRFASVEGLRLHYVQEGTGPDVVLIHGASGNLRDFTFDLLGRLSPHFRVTAFDRPGMGWSDDPGSRADSPLVQADILRAAAGRLGLRRPVVVGHSYGGAVAMGWALGDPEGTGGVVSLAGATHPWPGGLGPFYPIAASGFGAATIAPAVTAFAPMDLAPQVVARVFAPQAPPAGYADHIGAGLAVRRTAFRANARHLNALKGFLETMAPRYPSLSLPVEILHGDRDRTVGLEIHGRALARDVAGARLTVLEGVGHMPHHAAPEAAVAAIARVCDAARG